MSKHYDYKVNQTSNGASITIIKSTGLQINTGIIEGCSTETVVHIAQLVTRELNHAYTGGKEDGKRLLTRAMSKVIDGDV